MTDERTYLTNGQFLHDLTDWDVTGATYSAGDGDAHYGVAQLAVGQAIAQDFAVDYVRAHTLALALKCSAPVTAGQVTVVIEDEDGNVLTTLQPTCAANAWRTNDWTLGLASGTTYTITITNVGAGAAIKLDDIWLWPLLMTRAGMAQRIHTKLGRLATERSLSLTPNGAYTEGDYTLAIEVALRRAGAVNPETDQADARWLDSANVDTALETAEREMLERLQRDYAVETDISVDGRSESRSQIREALEALTGGQGSGSAGGQLGRVQVKRLSHPRWEGIE